MTMTRRRLCALLPPLALLTLGPGVPIASAQQPNDKPAEASAAKPESLGFSSQRLERLHAAMQQQVDQKKLAGVVTLLSRHGKPVAEIVPPTPTVDRSKWIGSLKDSMILGDIISPATDKDEWEAERD